MKSSYQVVRFSPDPEVTEPINVALLVSDQNLRNSIIYDQSFPKLSCVAPGFDKRLLNLYLVHLQSAVEGAGADAPKLICSTSSQFTLSAPREIMTPDVNRIVEVLIDRYLGKSSLRTKRRDQGEKIQSRLEGLLVERFGFPSDGMLKQARPVDYLTRDVYQQLAAKDFSIARVMPTPTHLFAVDAIDATAPRSRLEERATRIGYAFHQLGKIKNAVHESEGKSLVRTAIVLGQSPVGQDAHVEYMVDMLHTKAEFVFDSAIPDAGFVAQAKNAIRASVLPGLH